MGNHLIVIMTLFWLPPRRQGIPGCDSTLFPVHISAGIFRAGIWRDIVMRPAPDGGRAGARGVIITMKRGFLQSKKSILMVFP